MTYFPTAELGGSIIGAALFQDSVRNGKSWFQSAPITKAKDIITNFFNNETSF